MSEKILEIVEFRLNPNVTTDAFLKASEATVPFLKSQPGYIARHLSCNTEGLWYDIVEWTDIASAKAAAEAFMKAPVMADFGGSIDFSTTKMGHFKALLVNG
jgi:hypothetical protein